MLLPHTCDTWAKKTITSAIHILIISSNHIVSSLWISISHLACGGRFISIIFHHWHSYLCKYSFYLLKFRCEHRYLIGSCKCYVLGGGICLWVRWNEYKSFTREVQVIWLSIEKWCRTKCFKWKKIVLFVESTVRLNMDVDCGSLDNIELHSIAYKLI